MNPSPDSGGAFLDELLAQAGWMRSLARSLVADAADADEVVQDAWVVALEKRGAVRVDLAGWLRSVVRNLALRRAERERRRPAVEERVARPEAGEVGRGGEVRDAVERMELQRWLASALLALDEPYRSAVILRHVEELDPGAIAARQGCTREAARQRVARGLAHLRRELDARHGGREAWCLLLAPIVRSPAPFAVPLTSGGILLGTKTVLASLVALALVLVWWSLDRAAGTPERGTASAATLRVDTATVPDEPAPASRSVEPARESASAVAAAAEQAPSLTSNPLFARLAGRVLDEGRSPVAGAEVVVRRPEVGHFSILDLEVRRAPKDVARAFTDADGRFAFELERGIPFDLAAQARGFGDDIASQRYAGEEVEIVLARGTLVHGLVTRQRDGAPIAGARVRIFQLNRSDAGARTTTTDENGRYELRHTFRAGATLEVTPQREMGSNWLALDPGTDGTVRMDVALPDGIEVRGHVRAAEDGAPIAGARVGEGWTYRRSATTDASGAFALPGFGVEGVQELYARAPGFGQVQRANLPAAVDGVLTVDFVLPRGRRVRGRVLDAEGHALAAAYVAAVASVMGTEGQRTDWVSGSTDRAGDFELGGLTPDLRHCLLVSADGFATQVYDFPPDELEQPEVLLPALELAPPAVFAGRVQDEEGRPVGDVEVTLTGANRDRARFRVGSTLRLDGEGDWYVNSREARSDSDGRFWFGALPAGTYEVRARRAGSPSSPASTLEIAEGEMRDGFVLTFPRGETIRGTIVDEAGHGLDGVYVIASLRTPREGSRPAQRDAVSARTHASGAFELQGLVPGTYRLMLHPYELESDPDSPWLSDTVEGVASGGDALRLVLPRGVAISGRLVDLNGAALVGFTILATRAGDPESPGGATDAEGRFHFAVRPGTIWDLAVRGAPQTDAWESIFAEEPSVAAGTRELVLRADPARPMDKGDADPSTRRR